MRQTLSSIFFALLFASAVASLVFGGRETLRFTSSFSPVAPLPLVSAAAARPTPPVAAKPVPTRAVSQTHVRRSPWS